jgi:non-ribosomal peptide synthetase component F
MTSLAVDNRTAKFDQLLTVRKQDEGLSCLLEYSTDLFEPATITRFLKRFEAVLGAVVADPEARLDALRRLLAEAEREEAAARQKRFREAGRKKLRELSLK